MDVFGFLIAEFLYRPVYNILVAFLEIFEGNLGWAIVGLTLVVRLLLLNISLRGTKAQKWFHDLQPKIHEVQEKYKDDPEKQSAELMKVFKKEGAGPLKGCLGMLLQIPVFIGLFFVIRRIAANEVPVEWIYSFMGFGEKFFDQDFLEMTRLGMDLLATENGVLAIVVAVMTFAQMSLMNVMRPASPAPMGGKSPADMGKMMKFMNYFLVFVMASFVYSTSGAIGIYILVTTLFTVLQYAVQYRAVLLAKTQEIFRSLQK